MTKPDWGHKGQPFSGFVWFVLLLAGLAVLLYGQTLHTPWYLDDYPAIVENPDIRNISRALSGVFEARGVALLSFALNYHFGGINPSGYHLVNLFIHCGSTLLVYALLRRVFRAEPLWPMFGAGLFFAHPLQTQAVTYVVQRMTSLSACFFLLALFLFVRHRELLISGDRFSAPRPLAYYCGALAAGILSLLCKETAIVLPLALWLFSRFFLGESASRRCFYYSLLPFVGVSLLLVVQSLLLPLMSGRTLAQLAQADQFVVDPTFTPLHYLVTEWSVLWIYLRLFLLPYGQTLDPAYPVVRELLTLSNVVAGAGLVALAGLGWMLRRRWPRQSFAIAWFFLCLSVESTIIPLDPLFEHRLYLPLFGLVIALLDLVLLIPLRRVAVAGLTVIIVIMAVLTWQRNALWNNPVAFYAENLRSAPQSVRLRGNLALNYLATGRYAEAERLLREVLALRPQEENVYINLSKLFCEQQRYDEGLAILRQGLETSPNSIKLLNNLGSLYSLLRQAPQALDCLNRVIALDPDFAPAYTNIGVIYGGLGRWAEAERWHRQALERNSNDPLAYYNLGLSLEKQGRYGEALAAFRRAVALNPGDLDSLRHGIEVSRRLGDQTAFNEFVAAQQRARNGRR